MVDNQETEVDRLKDIMESLPDANDYAPGQQRREYTLTKGDVLLIYRIARVAMVPHICPFATEEAGTLQAVAKSINKTQKIAGLLIVTAIVTGTLTGIWKAGMHFFEEYVLKSGK